MITGSTFVHDTRNFFRDDLRANLSDPLGRAPVNGTSGVKFVRTAWPDRRTDYPVVTVDVENAGASSPLGLQSTVIGHPVRALVRCWSKKTTERDRMADDVLSRFAGQRLAYAASGLHDLSVSNITNVDETGNEGDHIKVIETDYFYVAEVE